MIRLIIPAATPSLNEINRGRIPAWVKMKVLHELWAPMVALAIANAKAKGANVLPPSGRRRLTIERHGRNPLDWDNLCGGCKVLVDELKAFKLIVDDDQKNIDARALNVKLEPGEMPFTVVIIEDVS